MWVIYIEFPNENISFYMQAIFTMEKYWYLIDDNVRHHRIINEVDEIYLATEVVIDSEDVSDWCHLTLRGLPSFVQWSGISKTFDIKFQLYFQEILNKYSKSLSNCII